MVHRQPAPAAVIGLEACVRNPPAVLEGARFGLLMNQASVDGRLRYACDVLAERFPGRLRAIFSPQHGLWSEQQANMIESPHTRHPVHDVPVYSLYSETRRPTRQMLDGLDRLVVDLQDVGTRVYTFAWSVSHCLEACAEAGLPVVVLDRPNPIDGVTVEGPLLEREFESFVGRASIPMRHGLTLGELMRFINVERSIGADVHVVPLEGWDRSMLFPDTGRAWVAPSPNLPTWRSALAYPGQVLLEGTNLSEGRGTTTPFEVCGAPFIDPFRLAAAIERFELPGVRLRPVRFVPTFDKWAGRSCGGVFLHVTDPRTFRAYQTTVSILGAVRSLWPEDFRWSDPPYEYETGRPPIDFITGSSRLRQAIDKCGELDPAAIADLCRFDEAAWRRSSDVSWIGPAGALGS
ncbi:MAG TPA: DUF1343 domain-containing protein [Planctomycetaceae bacterium]|nr:DUF1343 domain-containing protein [Planctomycetaceae bacterium]